MSWTIHNEYLPSTAFGACFKCRADRRPGERVLDPNLVTDELPPGIVSGLHDGHVMFCESCITEAAQLLGMHTAKQSDELRAEVAELLADASALSLRAAAAEAALDALRKYDEGRPRRAAGGTGGR